MVTLEPKPGRASEVEELLDAVVALPAGVRSEPTVWAALDDGSYVVIDVFSDESSRRRHLAGPARQALAYRAHDLFARDPEDTLFDGPVPIRGGTIAPWQMDPTQRV